MQTGSPVVGSPVLESGGSTVVLSVALSVASLEVPSVELPVVGSGGSAVELPVGVSPVLLLLLLLADSLTPGSESGLQASTSPHAVATIRRGAKLMQAMQRT